MQHYVQTLLKSADKPFNIIEEFAKLAPNRKTVLSENVFSDNSQSFEKTVRLIWPTVSDADISKLRNFLILLKQSSR